MEITLDNNLEEFLEKFSPKLKVCQYICLQTILFSKSILLMLITSFSFKSKITEEIIT